MAKSDNLDDFLTDIADAIRNKKGTTNPINAQDFSSEIESIKGGDDIGTGKYVCRVIDYDGTILKEERHNEGEIFVLPDEPTHDRLVFQDWSSPVEIVHTATPMPFGGTVYSSQITVENSDIIIGPIYATASGLTEFDITLTKKTGLSVTLNVGGTKNWGDGITDTETTHTYVNYGDYTITCDSSMENISTSSNWFGTTLDYFCRKVFLGTNVTEVCTNAVYGCRSLQSITIPISVTSIGDGAFRNCHSLPNIIIPNGISVINKDTFFSCQTLLNIVLPYGVTTIGQYAMSNCYSLSNMTIPSSVTNIQSYAINNCSSLHNRTIPNSVINIGDEAFSNGYGVLQYDFSRHTSIPVLSTKYVFSNINHLCKIIVPDDLYDEWRISDVNWSTYAEYIYKASEVVEGGSYES